MTAEFVCHFKNGRDCLSCVNLLNVPLMFMFTCNLDECRLSLVVVVIPVLLVRLALNGGMLSNLLAAAEVLTHRNAPMQIVKAT